MLSHNERPDCPADSTGRRNTSLWKQGWRVGMAYRRRSYFTEKQKSEIWDRWQRGESMSSIGRLFDRGSSSIYPLLARTGGIGNRFPQELQTHTLMDKTCFDF